MRILASTGYITLEPGRGAFVRRTGEIQDEEDVIFWFNQNQVEVRDYLEIRSVCEPLAAKLAIERCSQKDLARLHSIHNAFVKATEEHDMQSILLQEGNFHDSIIELSQNQLLINIFRFSKAGPRISATRVYVCPMAPRKRFYRILKFSGPLICTIRSWVKPPCGNM